MDDLISRQAAIDVLHGYFDGALETDTICPKDIYNLFEIIPSAQPEYSKIAIDAEALMDAFYKTPQDMRTWSHAWSLINRAKLVQPDLESAYQEGYTAAESKYRAMMDAQPEQRWIPCSERLPFAEYGESESVLSCLENGIMEVLYFDGGNWCYPTGEPYIGVNHKNGWHNRVVAWMPLPEPWKGEQE